MLDWDDLRFFLAVARHGTLATAARHLHVTQSTVSRRLASLQERMGVRLLQRSAEGYLLTLAGQSIMDRVKRVEAEALSVERAVAGHDVRLDGIVRVASSQMLASHVLAACFATVHARHPGLMIEAVADIAGNPSDSIEPDVLVRLRRFDQHDLIVRNIGTIVFGLYGSVVYLDRHGEPDLENGCAGHQLITLLDDRDLSTQASWLTEHADRAHVALRADSYETQHWVATGGGGLALLPRFRADAEPALRRLDTPVPIPAAEIWLGVHRENRQVPRVRAVLDCLADAVRNRSTRFATVRRFSTRPLRNRPRSERNASAQFCKSGCEVRRSSAGCGAYTLLRSSNRQLTPATLPPAPHVDGHRPARMGSGSDRVRR